MRDESYQSDRKSIRSTLALKKATQRYRTAKNMQPRYRRALKAAHRSTIRLIRMRFLTSAESILICQVVKIGAGFGWLAVGCGIDTECSSDKATGDISA